MSAIWGVIDLQQNGLVEAEVREMEKVYRSKKIDRIDTFFQLYSYMACGVQYVNKEALQERFPYTDKQGNCMVADVLLDNRKELQERFDLQDEMSVQGIDGNILFASLQKDLDKTLETALGAFAFVYYEQKTNQIYLASDAVGNRSVYYCVAEGRLYFSTLLEGILLLQKSRRVNKTWFDNYFGCDDLRVVTEARETPYEGIYRVEPGEVVSVSSAGVKRRAYWDPFRTRKTIRLSSDEEYKKLVCSVFQECVESMIREGTETGILLSGGLDSNAVAAFAAPALREQNRKLYSFTSVPDKRATRIPQNTYYVEDETEYIEELLKWHDNLVPSFMDASEGDLLAENRRIQEILEIPFKTVLNMPWIYRAYCEAAKKKCGIILSGQYGNITISYGNFRCLFATLWRKGRLIRLWKEINAYSKRYRKSRKWIIKDLLETTKEDTFEIYTRYMYDKNALRQVGETEVKYSLDTGVIPRDPTRDKRLIELVLSLPVEQFVSMGHERRLVRKYMKELIPAKIVEDDFHRGKQGVGSRRLLYRQWEQIAPELKKVLEGGKEIAGITGFHAGDLLQELEPIDKLCGPEYEFEIVKLFYSALTCEYLEKMYE